MVGVGLALASAAVYGVVDFTGGVLSRRIHFAVVAFVGQLGGLVVAVLAAFAFPATAVSVPDMFWGGLSGIGSGVTMLMLNRGISRGSVSIVVPVSAVTGVALSVACGVVFLDERPGVLPWLGIALVIPALWWISGGRSSGQPAAVRDGLAASCGVAVQYVALGLASADSGLWPVAIGRVAAVLVLALPAAKATTETRRPADMITAAAIGGGAAVALILYLLAVRQEMLAIAVTVASLYPALPVLLGLKLLHERLTRRQTLGLAGAGLAVVLLTMG